MRALILTSRVRMLRVLFALHTKSTLLHKRKQIGATGAHLNRNLYMPVH